MVKDARSAHSAFLVLALAFVWGAPPVAVAADGLPVSSASVVVTDPTVLPPPGSSAGWVGRPCSHDVLFVPDWYVNGEHFNDVFARAHDAIVSGIGTPTMTTVGSDVLSTFNATLHLAAPVVVGLTLDVPMALALPGTITARFIGKAGKTTGTFLIKIESMSFAATLFTIPLAARQDPGRDSTGSITVTSLGNSSYRVDCALDAYTQMSIRDESGTWMPYVSDSNAPLHLELRAPSCPPPGYPLASFTVGPSTPQAGHGATLTDTSAGSPTSWAWEFGDGTTSTLRNPSHIWAARGTYAVRLTVTNSEGSDSYGTIVTVTGGLHDGHPVHRVLRRHGS